MGGSEIIEKELLRVTNLKTYFYTEDGVVRAVNGVSFGIAKGETVGLVGETGCGKSVTALSILRLVPFPGQITNGEILFEDQDILKINVGELRKIRGNKISMIFQEPMTALNPLFTVGDQVAEAIKLHQKTTKGEAKEITIKMFKHVRIPDPEIVIKKYPHELSGGMQQRTMIAMALSCNPRLLMADEPTTSLDVTIQAQILELMKELKHKSDTSILLITHDLGIVVELCERIMVMYAGRIVEKADLETLFESPKHPYTQGLLRAATRFSEEELHVIPGEVPDAINLPPGCKFHPRCSLCEKICVEREPDLVEVKKGHLVACHFI